MKKLLISLLLAALPLSVFAASGTPIPGGSHSGPYNITKPGAYYLEGDRIATSRTTNGHIQIQADNVTLDLNGFTVSYAEGTPGSSVYGSAVFCRTKNVEVRNGVVANSPFYAVDASVGGNFRLIDVRVINSVGVNVQGPGSLIERCHFLNMKGWGVNIGGVGTVMRDSTVRTVARYNNWGGRGIMTNGNNTVFRCHISDTVEDGIEVGSNGENVIEANTLFDTNTGKIAHMAGIGVAGKGNIIRNNMISNSYCAGINVDSIATGNIIEANQVTSTRAAAPSAGAGFVIANGSNLLRGNTGTNNAGGFTSGTYVNGGGNAGM